VKLRPRLRAAAIAGLLLAGGGAAAAGDVLVLQDGRRLPVESWWDDGDRVVYERYGGTIAIPRARIREILPGDDGPDRREGPPPGARSYGARRPAALEADGPAFDPIEPGEAPSDLPALEARYAAHPEEREQLARPLAIALVREGNAAMRAADPEEAAARYDRAAGLAPELTVARANLAMAYLALGRPRDALSQAEELLRSDPDDVDALYIKGLALYRDERTGEAIRAWEQAESLEPRQRTAERLAKARREHAVDGEYRTAAGTHFLLRYDDATADAADDEAILAFLEDRYRDMVTRYNHLPDAVIVVILYPRGDFHDVTQTGAYTGGIFDGKIRVPVGRTQALDDSLRRALVHELTHSFVHGKTRGACPTWLHEGLAQLEEGRRASAATRLDLARTYRSGAPGWGRDLDYPSSLALTEHLIARHGFPAVLLFLERLGKGASEPEALRSAFGTDMNGLLRDWGESLSSGEFS
jgi:tetratricopeptide (TPR) repeat protein